MFCTLWRYTFPYLSSENSRHFLLIHRFPIIFSAFAFLNGAKHVRRLPTDSYEWIFNEFCQIMRSIHTQKITATDSHWASVNVWTTKDNISLSHTCWMNLKISTNSQMNGVLNEREREANKSNERKMSKNKSSGLQEKKKNKRTVWKCVLNGRKKTKPTLEWMKKRNNAKQKTT